MFANSSFRNQQSKIQNYFFLLASASPRRVELLRNIVSKFEVLPAHLNEVLNGEKSGVENAVRLATEKARAVFQKNSITLGVDTLGEFEGNIFGKPKDRDEARALLTRFSGKTHAIISGFCVKTNAEEITGFEKTFVTFRELSAEEIENYVRENPVTSFAGGYAIQGFAKNFVARIDGELENVIGLPLGKITAILTPLLASN